MTTAKISIFGGAHVDRRARISGATVPGASNPGAWFEEAGGGGFNAARNLARLGHTVSMIAPRGGDAAGDTVAAAAEAAGVIDCAFTFLDRATPSYTAILEADGNLVIALADMELYRLFTPRRLRQRAMRDLIADSALIMTDANLPAETIASLAETAARDCRYMAGIAISPAKVVRFHGSLDRMDFLFMNEAEARALTGKSADRAEDWPTLLQDAGLSGGVVTRGAKPAIAFRKGDRATVLPPALDRLGDVTGAGDALASGFLHAFLDGEPLGSCLRHGVAAAAITVLTPLAVSQDMSVTAIREAISLVPDAEILS